MIRAKDGGFFISNWLRNRNTVEYLGIWERIYNKEFNCVEFDTIKSKAGLNSYRLSIKEWIEKTNAIGFKATAEFKIYLIKEFQRLKNEEADRNQLTWNLQRTISKINYRIHTDAIRDHLIQMKSLLQSNITKTLK